MYIVYDVQHLDLGSSSQPQNQFLYHQFIKYKCRCRLNECQYRRKCLFHSREEGAYLLFTIIRWDITVEVLTKNILILLTYT